MTSYMVIGPCCTTQVKYQSVCGLSATPFFSLTIMTVTFFPWTAAKRCHGHHRDVMVPYKSNQNYPFGITAMQMKHRPTCIVKGKRIYWYMAVRSNLWVRLLFSNIIPNKLILEVVLDLFCKKWRLWWRNQYGGTKSQNIFPLAISASEKALMAKGNERDYPD